MAFLVYDYVNVTIPGEFGSRQVYKGSYHSIPKKRITFVFFELFREYEFN